MRLSRIWSIKQHKKVSAYIHSNYPWCCGRVKALSYIFLSMVQWKLFHAMPVAWTLNVIILRLSRKYIIVLLCFYSVSCLIKYMHISILQDMFQFCKALTDKFMSFPYRKLRRKQFLFDTILFEIHKIFNKCCYAMYMNFPCNYIIYYKASYSTCNLCIFFFF